MLFWIKSARSRHGRKVSVARLMLGLWLVTCALAASPQLHRLLHKDAQSQEHYCLLTQLSQHSVTPSSGFVSALKPGPVTGERLLLTDFSFLSEFDFAVSDGRAPPSNLASTAVVG